MIRIRVDQTAGRHVGVADGLDFFRPVLARDFVEAGKHAIQQLDQFGWRKPGRYRREADDVGKQHRHVVEAFRDDADLLLELFGNLGGQHVEQQPLVFAKQVVERQMRFHPRQQFVRAERLGDIVDGAELEAAHDVRRLGLGRQEDDRNFTPRGRSLDALACFKAVHLRHHDVEEDQIGPNALQRLERLPAVDGDADLVSLRLEDR